MNRYLGAFFMVLAIAANVVGCGGGGGHGGGGGVVVTPGLTLSLTSGANQSTPDGSTLPQPVVFAVVDQNGNVVGATVTVSVSCPDGTTATVAATSSNGVAELTPVTLGHGSGVFGFAAQASFNGASSSLINFVETGTATSLAITKVSGDNQMVTAGSQITVVVQVVDQAGFPAVGASAEFSVNNASPVGGVTDNMGRATFTFKTTAPGAYTTIVNAGLNAAISPNVTFADTAQ